MPWGLNWGLRTATGTGAQRNWIYIFCVCMFSTLPIIIHLTPIGLGWATCASQHVAVEGFVTLSASLLFFVPVGHVMEEHVAWAGLPL